MVLYVILAFLLVDQIFPDVIQVDFLNFFEKFFKIFEKFLYLLILVLTLLILIKVLILH